MAKIKNSSDSMCCKDTEQEGHSSIPGGSANLYNHFGNIFAVSQKMGIVLPQDLTILLLGIYPKDVTLYHRETCLTMFTIALFITARNKK